MEIDPEIKLNEQLKKFENKKFQRKQEQDLKRSWLKIGNRCIEFNPPPLTLTPCKNLVNENEVRDLEFVSKPYKGN